MPQLRVSRVGLLSPEGQFLGVLGRRRQWTGGWVPSAPQRLKVQEQDAKSRNSALICFGKCRRCLRVVLFRWLALLCGPDHLVEVGGFRDARDGGSMSTDPYTEI